VDARGDFQHVCYNSCSGRGLCRRGFCHCEPGRWGKDCSSIEVHAAGSAQRAVGALRVYAYDLPWRVAYQPEPFVGWQDHDQIYMAWQLFAERFYRDSVVRTQNPW